MVGKEMNPIKVLKCVMVGHTLNEPSIINFIDSGNYLKKCSCCGLYVAKDTFGLKVTLTEKEALKLKREFEEEFPYSKKVGAK